MPMDAGIILALIAMLGFGISNFLAKKALKAFDLLALVFFRGILLAIIIAPFSLFLGAAFDAYFILLAAIISLIGFFPIFFLYKALRTGKLGIVMPIANSSIIYTVLLSAVFFRESLSVLQYAALALVIAGIITISLKRHKGTLSRGVVPAFITSILWGLTFFLWKIPVSVLGPLLTSFIIEFGIAIWALLAMKGELPKSPGREKLNLVIMIGIVGAIGSVSYSMSLNLLQASLAVPIVFSNVFVSTILARVFDREKLRPHQYISSAAIMAGIILLVM